MPSPNGNSGNGHNGNGAPKLRAEWICFSGKRIGRSRVVGFATEEELRHEQIADILGTLDSACRKIIEVLDIADAGRALSDRAPS